MISSSPLQRAGPQRLAKLSDRASSDRLIVLTDSDCIVGSRSRPCADSSLVGRRAGMETDMGCGACETNWRTAHGTDRKSALSYKRGGQASRTTHLFRT